MDEADFKSWDFEDGKEGGFYEDTDTFWTEWLGLVCSLKSELEPGREVGEGTRIC